MIYILKTSIKIVVTLLILLNTISVSNAESVYVKYRGNVSLDNFSCKNTSSSFVNKICYQKQNSYIVVLLGSTYYHYCRVPNSTFERWLGTSSKGSFYNSNIKGRFDCRLGGIPR